MGQTPTYALPWPELTDLPDGPDGFSDLAQATETAIRSNSLKLVGAGKAESTASVEVRANPYEPQFTIALPANARVVIVTVNLCIFLAGRSTGLFDTYSKWDGVERFHAVLNSFSNGDTADRGYTWSYAIKGAAGGNHTASIGLYSGAGAIMHTKSLIHSWVALG